jgi:hypothetical protein
MKKILAAFAAGLVALALGACSASQIQTAAGNVAAINGAAAGALQTVATSIVAACPAGEAFASAAAAATANPGVQIAAGANGMFCAINKAIVATAPAASAPAAASAPVAQ